MGKKSRLKKKIVNYFFDHPTQRWLASYLVGIILSAASGAIFAFGFSAFITSYSEESMRLATGGFSGFTQSIVLILVYLNNTLSAPTLTAILYFVVNIPALIFSFFKIGKKFTIITAINVGLSSLFISIFSGWGFVQEIANNVFIASSPLTRVLFAGICTGVSSGIALKFGTSCGGMDIIVCYVGMKKSTGIAKYNVTVNVVVILFYTIVNIIVSPNHYIEAILIVPFAIVYFLISSIVIDFIHIRNKKIEVEIITKNDNMTDILMAIFTHSCTILEGKGAYSHENKHVIKMVISSFETRKVVKTIKRIDPDSFISITPLQQVYGNFFINPFE